MRKFIENNGVIWLYRLTNQSWMCFVNYFISVWNCAFVLTEASIFLIMKVTREILLLVTVCDGLEQHFVAVSAQINVTYEFVSESGHTQIWAHNNDCHRMTEKRSLGLKHREEWTVEKLRTEKVTEQKNKVQYQLHSQTFHNHIIIK